LRRKDATFILCYYVTKEVETPSDIGMATTQPKTKLGQRQALALHISPKQTDDISPFPRRQEEALTKLAKKAKNAYAHVRSLAAPVAQARSWQ
jgi:hypothetical protein